MSKMKVYPRELLGKRVKTLRVEDKIPAVLFGPSFESKSVILDRKEFSKAYDESGSSNLIEIDIEGMGKERVLIKEVQVHPIKDNYLHVSLYVIDKNKSIMAEIPLRYEGFSKAEDMGTGFVVNAVDTITVHCLPDELPSFFVIDVSNLENPGDAITISDIVLPAGVTLDSKMEATAAVAYVATAQKVEDLEAEIAARDAAQGEAAAAEGTEAAAETEEEAEQE
jgi:large subunit ribosomal protein L25